MGGLDDALHRRTVPIALDPCATDHQAACAGQDSRTPPLQLAAAVDRRHPPMFSRSARHTTARDAVGVMLDALMGLISSPAPGAGGP